MTLGCSVVPLTRRLDRPFAAGVRTAAQTVLSDISVSLARRGAEARRRRDMCEPTTVTSRLSYVEVVPSSKRAGIFCLEAEWDSDLRRRVSVLPLLELVETLRIAKTIHRDVATVDELGYYLKKWGQNRYDEYGVLYLAGHGNAACLHLGRDSVDMESLAELLSGCVRNRVVYFGSCLTMAQEDDELKGFVRAIGANAVVGYARTIAWLDSAAFELLLLERLARGNRSDAFFNRLNRDHGRFAEELGLVVATKTRVFDGHSV